MDVYCNHKRQYSLQTYRGFVNVAYVVTTLIYRHVTVVTYGHLRVISQWRT